MDERGERNPDTGENIYWTTGAGIGDIFAKVAAKVTGKTAKKLATKVMEKGAEKTAELIGEKIYDKFSSKKKGRPTTETKGKEISALLQKTDAPETNKYQHVKDVYFDLL